MSELAFERMVVAKETGGRGVVITDPATVVGSTTKGYGLNMAGTMVPYQTYKESNGQFGILEDITSEVAVERGATFGAEGDLDLYNFKRIIAPMAVRGGTVTATTPSASGLTKLYAYNPNVTADDLDSATIWWGDPNVEMDRGAYGMLDNVELTSAIGGDLMRCKIDGHTQFPALCVPSSPGTGEVLIPALPGVIVGPLLVPGSMVLYVDPASAVVPTRIQGRAISVSHKIPTGVTYKRHDQGPSGNLSYDKTGRLPRHIDTTIVWELEDPTQRRQWQAGTDLKVRVVYYGPLIENAAPSGGGSAVNWYQYLEVTTWGKWKDLNFADYMGSNRTMAFTIRSKYQSGGNSWSMVIGTDI